MPDKFISEVDKKGFLDHFTKRKVSPLVVQRKPKFVLDIVALLANDHISE